MHGMCSAYLKISSYWKSLRFLAGIITEYVFLLLWGPSFDLQSRVLLQNFPAGPRHYIIILGTCAFLRKRITNHVLKAKVPLSRCLRTRFVAWLMRNTALSWIDLFHFTQVSLFKHGCIPVRRKYLNIVHRVTFVQLVILSSRCLSESLSCLISPELVPISKLNCTPKPES